MNAEVATVLGHSVKRMRGTVHLQLTTDKGAATFRFTPADAQIVGSELRMKAVRPPGERTADPSAPVEKPGGGIL